MTKLEKIELNLESFKLLFNFQGDQEPLVIHFDTPARRFYFSVIALVVKEMKNLEKPGFIYIRKHEKTLRLLDNALSGSHTSTTIDNMWEKIKKAWRERLPDLESAALFKIQNRNLIKPYEKGGKYRYECLKEESDIWANLFAYDENNIWRFKFAVDSAPMNFDDVSIVLGNLKNNEAWQEFISRLSEVEKKVDVEKESKKKKYKKWHWPAVVIVALLILFIAGIPILNRYFRPVISPTETQLPDIPSIAVLPFINLGGDSDNEYFSDGITEDIINNLARIKDLRVISRTSSFYFKNKDLDLRSIGEKLEVENVLEGSVRVSGNRLKISAQLIKVADDSHLWADTYDRGMKDIFNMQENLAHEIVCNLKPLLGCKDNISFIKYHTESPKAYVLYLKGRHFWINKSHEKAIEYFEQALSLDPNYALAYTGLADVYNRLAFYFNKPVKGYYLKAKESVLKALEIDDQLSEAHASLGYLKTHYEWDWDGAEKALNRAIELNHGNVLAHRYYFTYLKAIGNSNEAFAEIRTALELDPLNRGIHFRLGMIFLLDGQVDKAIEQLQRTLELYPNFSPAVMFLGLAYIEKENYEEGIDLLKKGVKLTKGKSPLAFGYLGYAYGVSGNREQAINVLNDVLERRKKDYFSPYYTALIYTGMGDKDKAFEWLEKGYEERDPRQYSIKASGMFKSLHTDSRWPVILKKMGFEK